MSGVYLSRLLPGAGSRQAGQDARSPYARHQTLRWAFPGAGEPGGAWPPGERLLWRQEQDDQGRALVLAQSLTPPDWAALNRRHPDYLEGWDVKQLDLAPALQAGRPLRFQLRANVTVRKLDERGRSRRHALRGPHEQLAWLERQGERAGFSPLDAGIVHSGDLRTRKGSAVVTLHTVTFEGLLRVQEPQALLTALHSGLGHARALGLGLLSLAPA